MAGGGAIEQLTTNTDVAPHRPVLLGPLPDGWTVDEAGHMTPPVGVEIEGRIELVGHRADPVELAGSLEIVPGVGVQDLQVSEVTGTTLTDGRRVAIRTMTCSRDGTSRRGQLWCTMSGQHAVVVVAWWNPEIDGVDRDVSEIVGASHASPSRQDHGEWSVDELAVCAALLRAETFPTLGPYLGTIEPDDLDAIFDAALPRLFERGCLARSAQGVLALTNAPWATCVMRPELTGCVERFSPEGSRLVWFGRRPERTTRISTEASGGRLVYDVDGDDLLSMLIDEVGMPADVTAPADRFATEDELAQAAGEGSALVRISTAWREGQRMVGGVTSFIVDTHGSVWELRRTDNPKAPWELLGTDLEGVRALVADQLPDKASAGAVSDGD
jgi:hypothetical protein